MHDFLQWLLHAGIVLVAVVFSIACLGLAGFLLYSIPRGIVAGLRREAGLSDAESDEMAEYRYRVLRKLHSADVAQRDLRRAASGLPGDEKEAKLFGGQRAAERLLLRVGELERVIGVEEELTEEVGA